MTSFVASTLAARGLEPVIAHYAPYSTVPGLSVPLFKLLRQGTGCQSGLAFGRFESHAIGAWLPELEFTHYAATRHWRHLMDSCDAFVAVSGNVLASTPFHQTGRPYLAWVATDWQGDRRDRVKHFPLVRRLLDTFVNAPIIRRLEKQLLRGGPVLSLSNHTACVLGGLAGAGFEKVILPVAIDSELFTPDRSRRVPRRLGFAGRFSDPRKNITLLLQATARLRLSGHPVDVVLMGDSAQPELKRQIAELALGEHVTVMAGLSRAEMRDLLQSLDVFVLPSHQEGLCISALEAMACGIPVVSTRCGGPEEFVIPGVTGELVDSQPQAMAAAIASILGDEALRARMSGAARELVERRYGKPAAEALFMQSFRRAFPSLGGMRAVGDARLVPVTANDPIG